VARLDDAMEKLSALIVTRHRLARAVTELAATGSNVRALKQILSENARQLRELRAAVLSVRMVRMAEVLERVPLLVRGLRRNTGKQVKLVLDTGDAEVDKAVADRLFPAIVHLVRNAVDHAIESPAARRTLGKPEEGVLRIACRQRGGNQLELSIEDDGSGVDRELVARRAKREVPDTDAGLLELLCLPGLSTRSEATTTSGRGMGMDIVRRVAEDELGGELLMHTAPGVGTTFTLRVPLTITIVDAFTFECADQRYVVPVSTVEEIVELDAARLTRTPGAVSRASLIQRRGEALPVLQLAALFGLPQQAEATRALVIRRGGEATGFAVHRMLGQQEVVVRPMQDSLVRVTGITGATDLGDGRPTLVLDLAAIAGVALGKEAA
jgi:two-component system chemotaxis sensor kinase CheA